MKTLRNYLEMTQSFPKETEYFSTNRRNHCLTIASGLSLARYTSPLNESNEPPLKLIAV
ncbi:hypothetical protein C8K63_10271 [Pseudomonas sp. GV085]|nr:hypothetical protein C8K63_10271 [Pseudomonas sp. GV085]